MIKLFGRDKQNAGGTTAIVAEPGLDGLTARSVPVMADEFAVEYDRLAEKLGVRCFMGATGHRLRLLNALRSLNLPIYPLESVEQYLDRKGDWGWFPLRHADKSSEGKLWIIYRSDHKEPNEKHGYVSDKVYDAPVPFPVLTTVQDITRALQDSGENGRVLFMVAALGNNPDPFLGVRLVNDSDRRMIVVERWDEPGFRR